jgi:CheY-like chemotaxis protein
MRLPDDSPVVRGLREAETACERAADVAQQLLRFGRKSPVELRAVNIDECVREMARLLDSTIDPKVELELMLAPDLWLVQADATQIEQVVMNLCVNAKDAIDGAGRITIEAVNEVLTESNRRPHPDAAAGEFVRLSVIDTGCGMSEATRRRIFEPFFTTKHQRKGTGLGLAMVYAIVRNHHGWVEVFSKEGRGSAFHVYFPRSHKSLVPAPPPKETPEGGTATILLADDEAPIRGMARLVLEHAGYTVIEAFDGQEAVEQFQANAASIDLVVLDVIMPRQSGWEAAKRIREHTTTLPIVFSSGYTVDGSRDESLEFVNTMFLPKPYKPHTLLSTLRQALSRAPVAAPPA